MRGGISFPGQDTIMGCMATHLARTIPNLSVATPSDVSDENGWRGKEGSGTPTPLHITTCAKGAGSGSCLGSTA